jgi:Na+:H+ antiporter, NhaA family
MYPAGSSHGAAPAPAVAGGAVMLAAALASILLNNSPLAWIDNVLLDTPVGVRVGPLSLEKPLLHWINDGLMAIFFFYVGLEIKQEFAAGALSSWRRALLPAAGALGGMVMPAVIYAVINRGDALALRGWAIPAATDIAFAVAVLAMLGPRVPASLKVFLLALAILDDLGAIAIIAAFYTTDLSLTSLALAGGGVVALAALNRLAVMRTTPYLLVGVVIWVCVLKSGVHATLAGILVAMAMPVSADAGGAPSPLERAKHGLEPWVTFGILPLFAFANAGVSLVGLTLAQMVQPIPLGIAAGLVVGKPLGILAAVALTIRCGLGSLPDGVTWRQMGATAVVAGIGFTMSLFIGMLAFPDPAYAMQLRVGVLAGSLVSAVAGYALLWMATVPAKVP